LSGVEGLSREFKKLLNKLLGIIFIVLLSLPLNSFEQKVTESIERGFDKLNIRLLKALEGSYRKFFLKKATLEFK
jgi:hypothetical protein